MFQFARSASSPRNAYRYPLQRWDPRARLICALLASLGVVASITPQSVCVWGGVALVALTLRPLPAHHYRAFIPLNLLMLFLWFSLPFSVGGDALWPAFPSLSVPGVTLALLLTLKSNVSLAFLLYFSAGINATQLGCALQGMRVPLHAISLLLLTFRHLVGIEHDLRSSLQALQLRAPARRHLSLREKMWIYACMLGSVLVYATRQAEQVRLALSCKPTPLRYDTAWRLGWRRRDSGAITLMVLILLFVLGGERVYLAAG